MCQALKIYRTMENLSNSYKITCMLQNHSYVMDLALGYASNMFVCFFIYPSVHFIYIEKNLLSTSYVASIMLDAEATKILNKTQFCPQRIYSLVVKIG